NAHHREPPRSAVIVGHGAGSHRGRHDAFCRAACAAGMIVLAIDFRGHGESTGELDGPAHHDILSAAALLRSHQLVDGRRVCYRGSSMGGYYGLQAAADAGLAAAVLVCPASEEVLLARIDRTDDLAETESLSERGLALRLDADGMREYLVGRPSLEAARHVTCPMFLLHARGDSVVPLGHTLAVAEALSGPVDLKIVGEGDHSSIQGSQEMHEVTVRWLLQQVGPPPD
ncbi:MAG TPA: alpha/beta fold hydrolase, partial [Thermoleophilia bacterium]|nr:alpha/beta fold hydrolase [Thermoleophilia bacterium]